MAGWTRRESATLAGVGLKVVEGTQFDDIYIPYTVVSLERVKSVQRRDGGTGHQRYSSASSSRIGYCGIEGTNTLDKRVIGPR